MPSTNGHGPKRAILYARVSTDEQARSGYSLAQQLEALRKYATHEGYEVLEEVSDPGQSGASLERPGMDRVRDLVAGGGVSVVLAQDRDRFAREPAYHYLLRREFEEHGTKMRALNDRGDDSPEGELTDGILDQLAKFERAKTVERTRRGMLRKAREGRACSTKPKYGFRFNEARHGLLIHEPEMKVVEKIFRLAAEGLGFHAIQNRLLLEGVPTAEGKRVWALRTLKKVLNSDEYRPHSFEEIRQLVTPEVAARLNPHEEYGIQWYNRQKVVVRTVSEPDGKGGRRYRKKRTFKWRPKEEWVAIPVPAYLPRTLVDRTHAVLKNNRAFERKHPARTWELRGLMRCGCGLKMSTRTAQPKGAPRRYHYYECKRYRSYRETCPSFQKSFRAEKVEETVWSFVSRLLKEPERIKAGMEALIEQEQTNGPRHFAKEEATWAEKIAECSQLRSAYQDQQAAGLMTLEELGAKLKELERTRALAQAELDAITLRKERVEELETNRDVLLESLTSMVPEALNTLEPEERSRIYRMLQLEIIPTPQGLRVSGALGESFVKQERHLPVGLLLQSAPLTSYPSGSGFTSSRSHLVDPAALFA
jgi:site-specific DNA recombinase